MRKLYPNHIVIDIVERTPFALWQKDGEVHAIAADGAPIDEMRDDRYAGLPFVVGEGANARVPEFIALLEATGELRPRVEAGVLVGQRRWNLKIDLGRRRQAAGSRSAGGDGDASAPAAPVAHP